MSRLPPIPNRKEFQQSDVITFDIFDTTLFRETGAREDVFSLVGKQIGDLVDGLQLSAAEFRKHRIAAEKNAIQASSQEDDFQVTLEDIYIYLQKSLGISDATREKIRVQELEVEYEVVKPGKGVREIIGSAREQRKKVIFVSDMYLPSEFLRKLLRKYDLIRDEDRVFVSCEHSKSKWSGRLFGHVVEQCGPSHRYFHIGNCLHADIRGAQKNRLPASHFDDANLNRFEKILAEASDQTGGLSSALAGASRRSRLELSGYDKSIVSVTSGVVAPILVSFCLWILFRAKERNLSKLYFLSRDGEVLLEVCRILARKFDFDIDLRYLYGSRKTWNLPSLSKIDRDLLCWVLEDSKFLSVKTIMERLSMDPADIEDSLLEAGFPSGSWGQNLPPDQRQIMHELILKDPRVSSAILANAREKRSLFSEYLHQEGLVGDGDYGLVDLGWFGSMQAALNRFLDAESAKHPYALYFGLRSRPVFDLKGKAEGYYFDEISHKGAVEYHPQIGLIMEIISTADHGTVSGYEHHDGRVEPVLECKVNQDFLSWGFDALRDTLSYFCESLLVDKSFPESANSMKGTVTALIDEFWIRPTHAEAECWGRFPLGDKIGKHDHMNILAKPFTCRDALKLLFLGCTRRNSGTWFYGSYNQSTKLNRMLYKVALKVRSRKRA